MVHAGTGEYLIGEATVASGKDCFMNVTEFTIRDQPLC